MADPTAARDDKQSDGKQIVVPMAATTTIYAGSLVSANSSGFAIVAGDTASTVFLGVAVDTVVNSGAAGAKKITVATRGTFEFAFTGTATQALVYSKATTISDGQTLAVAATTTNDIAGPNVVEFIDASTVRVML